MRNFFQKIKDKPGAILTGVMILNFILLIPQLHNPFKKIGWHENSAFVKLAREMERIIPKNASIMARKPQLVYYYSGFHSFCYPFSRKSDLMFKACMKSDFILADNYGEQFGFLEKILQDSSCYFEPIAITRELPKPFWTLYKTKRLNQIDPKAEAKDEN